jgi:hypothetical protein
MIQLDDRTDEFITVRLSGGDRARLRVLLDWIALRGLDAKDGIASSCRRWREAPPLIDRMAIVHEHHWNRQAALLAAAFRTEATPVRSWIPRDISKAVAWLREP